MCLICKRYINRVVRSKAKASLDIRSMFTCKPTPEGDLIDSLYIPIVQGREAETKEYATVSISSFPVPVYWHLIRGLVAFGGVKT